MEWDVFIIRAAEDESDVAYPIAERLRQSGLKVPPAGGRRLRFGEPSAATIDQGLDDSRFGIVIISPALIQTPRRAELERLFASDSNRRKKLRFVLYRVEQQTAEKYFRMLDKTETANSRSDVDMMADTIAQEIWRDRGIGVFDEFHQSDREWFREIWTLFNRPAFRGKYHGYTGHEKYQEIMGRILNALNTGTLESSNGFVLNSVRGVREIKDEKLKTAMLDICDQIKQIDNLIETHSPYPGRFPGVVDEINRLRDEVILKLNTIWTCFRLHPLPIPSSTGTTMAPYDGQNGASRLISIGVVQDDALNYKTDVLALKYTQNPYGLDKAICAKFAAGHLPLQLPKPDRAVLQDAPGSIKAAKILLLGVKQLSQFDYTEIRHFGRRVLATLMTLAPATQNLALTIHGPGYGLDETEAFESELAGLIDAVNAGTFPRAIKNISFVEVNTERAERLRAALSRLIPNGWLVIDSPGTLHPLDEEAQNALLAAGNPSAEKPHAFVAMPFDNAMDDVFHYGIQAAVKATGLLCERADRSSFTGDIMQQVRQRLSTAKLVVADLSEPNPNVYLEVGYAWGRNVRTVLIAREGTELPFDVKGHRCLFYCQIKHLEEILTNELKALDG